DCLVEHLPGVFEAPAPQLMNELPAAEIVIVRLNVRARLAFNRSLLALAQDHAQRFHNRLRDIVLDRENIFDLAIVSLRPQMISVRNVDELARYSKPVAHFSDTALEHGRDLQLSSDLADVFVLSLEGERRCSGRDAQALDLRQC